MLGQAAKAEQSESRERLAKHAIKSEGAARIQAMLSLAKHLPSLIVRARDLDADGYLFNCANGTIDLRTGKLRLHDPQDLITKMSPVAYDPNARLAVWDNHLDRVTGGDRNLQGFIQLAGGYRHGVATALFERESAGNQEPIPGTWFAAWSQSMFLSAIF